MHENRDEVLEFFATIGKNLEALLAQELAECGITQVKIGRGGVHFRGTLRDAYTACLWSRTASRVLLSLHTDLINNADDLYKVVQTQNWAEHLEATTSFAVQVTAVQSVISHSHFAALKIKDAVVDQFRDQAGVRPSVDTENPQLTIYAYLYRDQVSLGIDLSGAALHRRGYREQQGIAPLKENLAAAILLRCAWPSLALNQECLLDPLCGAGTFPIEAALIATDRAPGLTRARWGFDYWRLHDAAAWGELLNQAQLRAEIGSKNFRGDIRGYDENPEMIAKATANAERAGVRQFIHFERTAVADIVPVAAQKTGLIITNPPYGERLGDEEDLAPLYAEIGETVRRGFQGFKFALFTGNSGLARSIGLYPRRTHELYNGPIECKLFQYEVAPTAYAQKRTCPKPLDKAERSDNASAFANRLMKNHKHLGRWLAREQVSCYRVYDADIPEYAFAIDVYTADAKTIIHMQEYEAPKTIEDDKADKRMREAIGEVLDYFAIPDQQLYYKTRRKQRGTSQYEKRDVDPEYFTVEEGANKFLISLNSYLDSGLFLDHRLTRALIAEKAAGKRFLNLFCYTGSATVYAASGGAVATTSVDMSNTYLDWARRNLDLNNIRGPQHRLLQYDVLQWLRMSGTSGLYDLIFLDPPSFSNSKRMSEVFDLQQDHVNLIEATLRLLAPGGELIFSNNFRKFKLDPQLSERYAVTDISAMTIAKDFERDARIHQCWLFKAR